MSFKKTMAALLSFFSLSLQTAEAAECNIDIINPVTYNKILDYLLIDKSDVRNYKYAFSALEQNDFEEADNYLQKIDSNIIMGHVLAQKYLSPKYKTKYAELKEWLEEYNDLPMAGKIYKLAVKKGGAKGLVKPKKQREASYISGWKNEDIDHLNASDKKYIRQQVVKFRKNLNKGKTKIARQVLEQKRFRMKAPDKYWDDMAATLSMKYLVDNYLQLAFKWSSKAAARGTSGMGAWVAGLSSWQQKKYKTAVPVTPSIDSLLYSEDGETCGKSYQRSTMYITQAPQGYTMERILWAHEEAYKRGITNPVSSSELFIELGEKVHLFLGERFNIKVTTPEDLTTLRSQFYYENYKQFAKEELKYGL